MTKTMKLGFGKRRKRTKAGDKRREHEQPERHRRERHPGNKESGGVTSRMDVALLCASVGLPVVPLHGVKGGRCTCRAADCDQPGRHPRSGIDADDATTDPRVIERWWEKWPDAAPGIVIGGKPDIIGVVSEGAAGKATEQKLREQNKIFKKTITITDNARKIRLYGTLGSHLPHGSKLGPGLTLLDEGEIVKAPRRLRGEQKVRFLDDRAPGKANLAIAPDWLLEPTEGTDEELSEDEIKASVWPASETNQPDPRFEYGEVRLKDVLTRPPHDEADDEVVRSIAESPSGPFSPIIVRRVTDEKDGKKRANKVEVIAGKRRLKAARLRGMETIKCIFFAGSETAARIIRIEEDLFRKHLTVLRRSELLAEWAELVRKTGYKIYGQVVRKRRGRPPNWLSGHWRELPAIGRTAEARRKILERATKIAGISSPAKEVAKAGGLDNNQKALLTIAKAGGTKAQVKKAKELAGKLQEATKETTKTPPTRVVQHKQKPNGVKESPPLQPDPDWQTEASAEGEAGDNESAQDEGGDDEYGRPRVPEDTSLEKLVSLWERAGGPKLWKYAPFAVRTEFTDRLRRAPYAAKGDVVAFIEEVFAGRREVYVRQLYPFAKTKGISQKVLKLYLRAGRYELKKCGPGPGVPWAYVNKNSDWKEQLTVIKDVELAAPLAAEREVQEQNEREFEVDMPEDPYFSDI